MFELTVGSDGEILIPEKALSALSLKEGDRVSLSVDGERIILEKVMGISREDYERLIEDASDYAKRMGLDEDDCYRIVEEYIKTLI